MNPDTAATVARVRQRIEQLREAVHESRRKADACAFERDEALRERWTMQRALAAGGRAAETIETLQETQEAYQRREADLREGLREVLRDLTALSRYLQP